MAAGLSMQENRIEELRAKLNTNATLTEEDFVDKVHIDVALPVDYLSEEFIHELDRLEPFGTDNSRPLFAQKDLHISGLRELGKTGRVLKLYLKDERGFPVEAIYFGDVSEFYKDIEEVAGSQELYRIKRGQPNRLKFACTYYPDINEFRGMRTIQIVIKNYKMQFVQVLW